MSADFLQSVRKQFEYYKMLGEKTFEQMPDEALYYSFNDNSNSVATLVKHLWGNMLSRWTDFMTTDGEKEWRNRDGEFENDIRTRDEMLARWEAGWNCLFRTLDSLSPNDLDKIVYIRNQGHTVMETINRHLAHYAYHIGQIVYVGKMTAASGWKSLSIPIGNSDAYNREKFSQPQNRGHFTDEFLNRDKK